LRVAKSLSSKCKRFLNCLLRWRFMYVYHQFLSSFELSLVYSYPLFYQKKKHKWLVSKTTTNKMFFDNNFSVEERKVNGFYRKFCVVSIVTFHLEVLFSWYLASETKNICWKCISLEERKS
jgi:hypothetical protein